MENNILTMRSIDFFSIFGLIVIDFISYRAVLQHAIGEFFELNRVVKNGSFEDGEIISYITKYDLDGRTQYAPLIIFFDATKKQHEFQSKNFSFSKPTVGAKIKVCYETQKPDNAIDNYNTVLLFKALVVIFVVLVLLGINIGILYKIFF